MRATLVERCLALARECYACGAALRNGELPNPLADTTISVVVVAVHTSLADAVLLGVAIPTLPDGGCSIVHRVEPARIFALEEQLVATPIGILAIAILLSESLVVVLLFDNFRFCILGYLGRLNAADISRICSSLIPSGSKPIFLEAM